MDEAALRTYLGEIEDYYKSGKATEHTYRGTLRTLLETLDKGITATNEPKRVKCGAPDYVVERNNLTIGYIEAKDIDVTLDKIEQDEQLGRYRRALENLVLTNYVEFRWYVAGERRMVASLATPRSDQRIPLDKQGAVEVAQLLHSFLTHSAEPISKPQDLAQRLARLTHMLRDVVIATFKEQEASDNLRDLYSAFQEVLLPDMSEAEFADMFAQTLAYGLFAACYNHKTGQNRFTRAEAAKEIPRTNPFLRKLFGAIAGPDLEDEPFIGFVDELTQVLAFADMDAILADFGKTTRQEDPIVHFYETFLAQYDPKLRELRGVYYTPAPVVSYIVRSVDHLLRTRFACADGLADTATIPVTSLDAQGKPQVTRDPRVQILDPATGTGTFLYHVIQHIRESYRIMGNAGMWSAYVREHLLPRINGFELLVAPYAMAHLKLSMQLAAIDLPSAERATWAYDFANTERLGVYLTNTLDAALKRSQVMFGRYISDEANEAAQVKRHYPIMVVLGNPPYAGHSANKGQWIDDLLHGKDTQTGRTTGNYFAVDGQPLGERNPKWLNDDYVKFLRFAQWRIEQTGYGILAFITNHGYLDNPTFRGMRQSLMQSFDEIYVLDLHGNAKKKERSPDGSKDENVFDIQQGVAIGIFVKRQQNLPGTHLATVHHAHLWGAREIYAKHGQKRQLVGGKYHWLAEHDLSTTEWTELVPDKPFYLFVPLNTHLREEYESGLKVTEIMPTNVLGFQTHRDHFAIDFDKNALFSRIAEMRGTSISDQGYAGKYHITDDPKHLINVRQALRTDAEWESHFIRCLYRPFDRRECYFSTVVMDRPRRILTNHVAYRENLCMLSSRQQATLGYRHVWVTRDVPNDCVISNITSEANQVFPLYLYPDPKQASMFTTDAPPATLGGRRPNLAPAFIAACEEKLNMRFVLDGQGDLQASFGPEDVFHYMYAIFHAPSYRERYAEFLKIDFPRLPLTANAALWRTFCALGERLVGLHLLEQFGTISTRYPEAGNNVVEKIEYTNSTHQSEQGCVWINKQQYFQGVPQAVWEFHIGGYQVCQKWLKDRRGRKLEFSDIQHYQRIVAALTETISLMTQLDGVIEAHGGWPIV